jgi:hypothetical protein
MLAGANVACIGIEELLPWNLVARSEQSSQAA